MVEGRLSAVASVLVMTGSSGSFGAPRCILTVLTAPVEGCCLGAVRVWLSAAGFPAVVGADELLWSANLVASRLAEKAKASDFDTDSERACDVEEGAAAAALW